MKNIKFKRKFGRKKCKIGIILCLILSVLVSSAFGGYTVFRADNSKIIANNKLQTSSWTSNGTIICNAEEEQKSPDSISDGEGGAIITWVDFRKGSTNIDIYVQKIDSSGVLQWETNGTIICNATGNQQSPEIVSCRDGGAIITWYDERDGSDSDDIYAQRIDSNGMLQWKENGIVVSNATGLQMAPKIINDGEGGVVITWRDLRAGNQDIYAQKVDTSGAILWEANGTLICNAQDYQNGPTLISDGAGGAIITWNDNRAGNSNIYAQRINSAGITQWEANGTVICNAIGKQEDTIIISDQEGGAVITWEDNRIGNFDIYSQKIDSSGAILWEANGTVICNAIDQQVNPRIIDTGEANALILWKDKRKDQGDIYAKMISYDASTIYPNGNGDIPGFNPIFIGVISVISSTIIAIKIYKRKKKGHTSNSTS